ncbi:hypothetical protein BD324DRAFT_648284 [Kockovaella imperatae]|uniref:BHLH domain-containing protein n=1 Tax=Kockovaella imperatae TaxID=4999 RepID=A0A1Y1UQB4_9TREE|nr:hypothetical protein BD324DRAFT_648284 [Kockovaella imperatae]ORX39646.1 hypothetical protein BD324DRAFT_648284 [Kockovaella imperatae]
MSAPVSAMASPATDGLYQPQLDDGEMPLDFLNFMGMEYANASAASQLPSQMDNLSSSLPESSSGSSARDMAKSLSQNEGQVQPVGPSQMMGMTPETLMGSQRGMELGLAALWQAQNGQNGQNAGEFDHNQAQLLQQQLEQIHMQSPIVFDPSASQSPLQALAQMLHPNLQSEHPEHQAFPDGQTLAEKWAAFSAAHGVFTPAPSGEMYPQNRTDLVAPMQLDLRNDHPDLGVAPLLSPAPSQNGSTFTSPVAAMPYQPPSHLSPLEALQEQQRQFQHQLAVLQHQQRQLEATAAAVAISPYMPASSAGPSRPVTTPGISGPHSNASTSSPGYFSPLTSPALESSNRSGHFASQRGRPHPLSALSSPALNPVGSSGGAQQTLSPAFGPQANSDLADADLLSNLQGFIEGRVNQNPSQFSLNHGTGPNRQSLPARSRPSPMMKPTPPGRKRDGAFSVPNSPVAFKPGNKPNAPLTSLPPSAIQSMQMSNPGSTPSTPSPVDLAQMMPPPPVPNDKSLNVSPMTPATLMNMAPKIIPPRAAAAVAAAANTAAVRKPSNAAAPPAKRTTSRLALNTAGKRALAMRPPSVGVKAATKGAAAAAATPSEGETRKSSHKLAEQRRRDSLKSGFDELRLLLPPINTEALDAETGEPLPGSSAPRLLPKSTLVPDDNPNRGVSKVALLKFSNEYIVRLHDKVEKRDSYIDKLRDEIRRLRLGSSEEVRGDEGEDLLEMDMLQGEEDDLDSVSGDGDDDGEAQINGHHDEDKDEDMDDDDEILPVSRRRGKANAVGIKQSPALQAVNPAPNRRGSLKSAQSAR